MELVSAAMFLLVVGVIFSLAASAVVFGDASYTAHQVVYFSSHGRNSGARGGGSVEVRSCSRYPTWVVVVVAWVDETSPGPKRVGTHRRRPSRFTAMVRMGLPRGARSLIRLPGTVANVVNFKLELKKIMTCLLTDAFAAWHCCKSASAVTTDVVQV